MRKQFNQVKKFKPSNENALYQKRKAFFLNKSKKSTKGKILFKSKPQQRDNHPPIIYAFLKTEG